MACDLETDPGERENRVDDATCQMVVIALRGQLDAWFLEYVDPAVDGVREAVTGT